MKLSIRLPVGLALLLPVLLLAGCATTPRVDWAARVGLYTFDQTVAEIGPPDKQAKLSDGSTVAEWVTQRSQTQVFTGPSYAYTTPYGYGLLPPRYVDAVNTPEYFLRLTFGPDGRLTAWKRGAR